MGILFKRISDALKNMSWDFDDIYLGAETPGNKVLKTDQVPGINTSQVLLNELGKADIKTVYDYKTNPNIDFILSNIHGEETDPIYNLLTVTKDEANHKNNVLAIHSSPIIPSILIPAKPVSPIALPYTDQAAMLAGQAGQVIDKYYFYTGSTSAWKWNGMSGGVIGNYTERLEVSGWKEWGTMPHNDFVPTWLKITGTYLVGSANINYLDFTYYKSKPSNTTDFDFVELVITQRTGGNADLTIPTNLSTVIGLACDEVEALQMPVQQLTNTGYLASKFEIDNPLLNSAEILQVTADTVKLSPGYRLGIGATTGGRSYGILRIGSMPVLRDKLTIILKARYNSTAWAVTAISNINLTGSGVQGGWGVYFSSSGDFRFALIESNSATQIADGLAVNNEIRGSSGGRLDGTIAEFIVTFDSSDETIIYKEGVDVTSSSKTKFAGRLLNRGSGLDFSIGKTRDSATLGSNPGWELINLQVLDFAMSPAQVAARYV
jgi:hypothetical protein